MESSSDWLDGVARLLQARPGEAMRIVVVDVGGASAERAASPPPAPASPPPAPASDDHPAMERVYRVKWNVQGHGAIAHTALEYVVKDKSPAAYAAIKYLMKHDPADRSDIVEMAQWPDLIKPPARAPYSKYSSLGTRYRSHHYINYTIDDPTQPAVPPTVLGTKPTILAGLTEWTDKLKHETDPLERGHALAFVCHFVGDIHQPLHCVVLQGDLFPENDFPEGDQGGNLVWWGDTQKLHSLWDGLVCRVPDDFANAVANLRNGLDPAAFPQLQSHVDFASWALETYHLGAETYADFLADTKDLGPATRTDDRTGDEIQGHQFTSPSKNYRKKATATAISQGQLAALRLADILIDAFG